ncbi:hypothetical protein FCM35_KLT19957 [Carex littledalei]|uniref:DUF7895 domain-containing protein n=1 Tax=Carex littledalei TaxID=544730 RepID=A0A833QV89_9POAL|nr:hypothetical protein FCM35_KLT19957 [Carex littledalei]
MELVSFVSSHASILVASVAVGAAATLLAKRLKPSETATTEALKDCDECGGSGLCSECNGEGYIFKKISEESARKARTASKSAATRYTAGLPTKWTYCFKCSSARSCRTCGGSGQKPGEADYRATIYGKKTELPLITRCSCAIENPDSYIIQNNLIRDVQGLFYFIYMERATTYTSALLYRLIVGFYVHVCMVSGGWCMHDLSHAMPWLT